MKSTTSLASEIVTDDSVRQSFRQLRKTKKQRGRNRGPRQFLGISAIDRQAYAGHGLPLADRLADVGSAGSFEGASDCLEELLADFGREDVALLGSRARLPDGLRERVAPVEDFVLAFGGAFLRCRLSQLDVLLHTSREFLERR